MTIKEDSYYDILGIDTNASKEEVRSAYRRLALLFHPDKCQEGQAHDATRFLKIKEAYEVLSDDFKKNVYDSGFSNIGNLNVNWHDFMNSILVMLMHVYNKWKEHKQNAIIIPINILLEDIYNKKVKKLVVNVKRLDLKLQELVDSSVTLYMSLLNFSNEYTFENVGDENMYGVKNDIIIKVNIIDKPNLYIDKVLSRWDLCYEKEITLYDYYFTNSFEIPFLNDEIVTVSYTSGKRVTVIHGLGLPYMEDNNEKRGDLFVHFTLKLPPSLPPCPEDNDSKEIKDILQKYFHLEN